MVNLAGFGLTMFVRIESSWLNQQTWLIQTSKIGDLTGKIRRVNGDLKQQQQTAATFFSATSGDDFGPGYF